MSSLARIYCRRCECETLHASDRCVHCATPFEVVIRQKLSMDELDARQAQIRQARRKKRRAA